MAKQQLDADDMFEDTRMSFGDHLEELRSHLWRAIFGFLIALFFSFFIGKFVLRIIAAPVEEQMREFYVRRAQDIAKEMADPLDRYNELKKKEAEKKEQNESLSDSEQDELKTLSVKLDRIKALRQQETLTKKETEELNELRGTGSYARYNEPTTEDVSFSAPDLMRQLFPDDEAKAKAMEGKRVVLAMRFEDPLRRILKENRALQLVTRRPALSTLSIQEAFMAYFKVCIGVGFVLGSPWIFYQIWLFVASGLYPHERKLVHVYLPVSLGLFLSGVVVCQVFVIPKAIEALLWFNEWLGLEPDLRFNEWLGFAIMMPLVFGISFQLPLVMMFLERIGIFTTAQYKSQWRIALFAIHVFAAIITPSVDIISMELLALPMFGLYWLGIILCRWNHGAQGLDVEVPESEDMVEV
jgi:sec-independent protein translocase protein TatC